MKTIAGAARSETCVPIEREFLHQLGSLAFTCATPWQHTLPAASTLCRPAAHHDAALRALEEKSALEPLSAVAKRNAADQLVMKATLQIRLGDAQGAVDATRRAESVLSALATADPTNTEAQHDLAFAHETEALAHLSLSQWREAKAAYERTLSIRRALLARDPANREDLRGIYAICGGLAKANEQLGDAATSARYRAEAERLRNELKFQ